MGLDFNFILGIKIINSRKCFQKMFSCKNNCAQNGKLDFSSISLPLKKISLQSQMLEIQ